MEKNTNDNEKKYFARKYTFTRMKNENKKMIMKKEKNNWHPLHPCTSLHLLNFLNNLTVENEFELSEYF